LQAGGWQPLSRGRSKPAASPKIDQREPTRTHEPADAVIGEIFELNGTNKPAAAKKALAFLSNGGSSDLLFAASRRLIFRKGRDAHDYKFGAASWEECVLTSNPRWRAPLAAAALFNFPSSKTPDSPLMEKARAAVKTVMT
jgi:hypothetical protein